MTSPSYGPCAPWSPIWCGTISPSVAAVTGTFVGAATEVLWAKSGRQFGFCDNTLRPCRKDCWGGVWPWGAQWWDVGARGYPWPYQYNGAWFNLGCGGCPGNCSCSIIYEALLPMPVNTITSVKVDGAVLDPSKYKLYNDRSLLRTDGNPWPLCNDLNKDDSQVGTWSITANFGVTVPDMGRLALGELVEQFGLACTGAACKLPQPVQQLVRQGVSLTFLDPNQVFADGKIGLYFCDLFISTFNPQGIAARAQAINVDNRQWRPS